MYSKPTAITFKSGTFKDVNVHPVPAGTRTRATDVSTSAAPAGLVCAVGPSGPPPARPASQGSSCLFTRCQPWVPAAVLECFSGCGTVRLKCFGFLFCSFFMYYLCEKYCNPITVQYYIAACVRWAPRLHLLDLGSNWICKRAVGTERIRM